MRRVFATLVLSLILPCIGAPGQAAARVPTGETIVLMRDANRVEIGWSASGTFTDAGSWTSDFIAFGGGKSPTFAGTIKTTETGANGTITMVFQVKGLIPVFEGNWQITEGTGAYDHLHGQGTWVHADDPVTGNGIFTCVGTVHFD